MKSIEWIEQLMNEKKLPSHRQAALMIGMAEPLMSKHRNGKALTLDDKYAQKLEELLDVPAGTIIADQHMERAQTPEIRAVWQRLGKLATGERGSAVAGVMVTNCLALFAIVVTYQEVITGVARNNCILCSIDSFRNRARIATV